MATYHFTMKTGGKGKAAAHACYISRDGEYARRPDLEYAETGNIPEWAGNDRAFWNAADELERANGTTYCEMELALPRELDADQRRELVIGFVEEHIGDAHPYTLAIHTPKGRIDGGDQPHVHIQFSERRLDEIERSREQFFKRANRSEPEKGGCAKDERWNGKDRAEHLEMMRESWEGHVNRAYEMAHRPERVSCKSLDAQGIERNRERHLGPKMVLDKKAVDLVRELREYQRELALIEWDRAALAAELKHENGRSRELEADQVAQVQSVTPQASRDVEPAASAQPRQQAAAERQPVNSRPLPGEGFPLQQPVFTSGAEVPLWQRDPQPYKWGEEAYRNAYELVIKERFDAPWEAKTQEMLQDWRVKQRHAKNAFEASQSFTAKAARALNLPSKAQEAYYDARNEALTAQYAFEARSGRPYEFQRTEWVRENGKALGAEAECRMTPEAQDARATYHEIERAKLDHQREQQRQRLELDRQKKLVLPKGRKGPGLDR